jgi:hypothetical protein
VPHQRDIAAPRLLLASQKFRSTLTTVVPNVAFDGALRSPTCPTTAPDAGASTRLLVAHNRRSRRSDRATVQGRELASNPVGSCPTDSSPPRRARERPLRHAWDLQVESREGLVGEVHRSLNGKSIWAPRRALRRRHTWRPPKDCFRQLRPLDRESRTAAACLRRPLPPQHRATACGRVP